MSRIRISYHVVHGDQVDPLVRSVSLIQNKNISDLRKAIATKEAVPGGFISIWKVGLANFRGMISLKPYA